MNFNIFNSLILAGIIQGFLFGLVWLFSKKYRSKSTYYLISLIIVYSLSNLQYYLLDIGMFKYATFYDLYQIPISLLMPPLLLLYGQSLIFEKETKKNKAWWLFLPFGIIFSLSFYYKYQLIVTGKKSGYSIFLDNIPTWSEFIAMLYGIIVLIYLLYTIHQIKKKHSFSHSRITPQLSWFKSILIFQFFSTLLWAYSEISFASETDSFYYYPLWIILAIIIYWLGHVGIYKYGVLQERKDIRSRTKKSRAISRVSKGEHQLIKKLNIYLITEKNFLDPNLSQEKVAEQLGTSRSYLSKIINTELDQSFKEYLNTLRVSEAKKHLLDPEFSNYTLVAIGLEAGFNSKSAFNTSFKKQTGTTPSQFKKQT